MNKTQLLSACASAVVLLSGCAAMNEHNISARQNKTSAVIGCAPKDISVEMTGIETWTATCRQKIFHCKIVPGVMDTSATCAPALQ
jgi:hypothetical protein